MYDCDKATCDEKDVFKRNPVIPQSEVKTPVMKQTKYTSNISMYQGAIFVKQIVNKGISLNL